ncbi:MAG: hypothetical protein CVU64_00935 [Deltaproteobacteria bacterium HGW-Deltaproteobacteria-21]|nr:MAG: hypothetical protein CVU64_00935 [Deltaproteobacteria bacterium HGW-Deltaproteobacteria-21]
MIMNEEFKIHYVAQNLVKSIVVRKKGWSQPFVVHVETVEISQLICCFECENDMLFTIGDELDFNFELGNNHFQARAVIQKIDRSEFLDELYDQKPMFCCCARFNDELTREIFERLAGPPLVAHSLV